MKRNEADEYAAKINDDPGLTARVVRILEEAIDPPVDGDNGWDVEITTLSKYKVEVIADRSGKWAGNAAQYDTPELAEKAARDLASRWFLVTEWRVVDCDTGEVVRESAGGPLV